MQPTTGFRISNFLKVFKCFFKSKISIFLKQSRKSSYPISFKILSIYILRTLTALQNRVANFKFCEINTAMSSSLHYESRKKMRITKKNAFELQMYMKRYDDIGILQSIVHMDKDVLENSY